jgi:hypothetical protein
MAVSNHSTRFALLCLALLLSGCSTPEGSFPSLERRPFETEAPVAESVVPAAPTALPDLLADKIMVLSKRHNAASASFVNGLPNMQRIAAGAAGRAAGSEAWVNAHLQLSRLDKQRLDSVAALSELDGLIADQIDGDTGYVALLVEVQEKIAAEVAMQKSEIERMSKQIGE